jgi:hypothetical protein
MKTITIKLTSVETAMLMEIQKKHKIIKGLEETIKLLIKNEYSVIYNG